MRKPNENEKYLFDKPIYDKIDLKTYKSDLDVPIVNEEK